METRPARDHIRRERLLQLDPSAAASPYDDRSGDCLDNRELKRVLGTAHQLLGRKVDLVGMDACLMTMIEVAYQIRDHAKILVGSEEVEPGTGGRTTRSSATSWRGRP